MVRLLYFVLYLFAMSICNKIWHRTKQTLKNLHQNMLLLYWDNQETAKWR